MVASPRVVVAMDLNQLKTFLTVAREGGITRASARLNLSQPAVSAHIKQMEDTLGLPLFERVSRGMQLTHEGQRLATEAERVVAAYTRFLDQAAKLKGHIRGVFRLGVGSNACASALEHLLTFLANDYPGVEVAVQHAGSADIVDGIINGCLDGGFYHNVSASENGLTALEVAHFSTYLAAPTGMVDCTTALDWRALETLPWICPASNTCCGHAASTLFKTHGLHPDRVISIDSESVTCNLIEAGVGLGMLHDTTAERVKASGKIDILCQVQDRVSVVFGYQADRAGNPLIQAVQGLLQSNKA